MTFFDVRRRWYRPSLKILVCLICFACGCTVSFSLFSSLECKSLTPMGEDHNAVVPKDNAVGLNGTHELSLVILIVSAPDNLQRRHTLRRTWLSLLDTKVIKYFFVIGKKSLSDEMLNKLSSEQKHYADLMILPEVEEGYDLLAIKVLRSFAWAYSNLNFKHVLKVDDDSFVDSRRLLMELSTKKGNDLLYWGYFNGRAQIQHRGKWKDTEWNLCDRYIPYARGGGYVLSRSVVQYLALNSAWLKSFKNEDVSVGLWLAPLNIERMHDVRFDTEWASRGCSNQHIITHPHSESDMQILHDMLTAFGKLCSIESQKRDPYVYDWSALPSRCCDVLNGDRN